MEDQAPRSLPDDVIADVLHRLAPRTLAVSRCVCRGWRAIIDERCVLRTDLLPVSLGGIFVNLSHAPAPPEFFARPSMVPKIAGKLENYVEMDHCWDAMSIMHSCNGLLLLVESLVVNPATRQWMRLPPCPALSQKTLGFGVEDGYIAFDPTMSPHYEVLVVQDPSDHDDKQREGLEWPPSPYMMCVYSSRTGRWEERPFVREGAPAGTIAQVRSASVPEYRHAAYWHGALYVHCRSDFIMRITLSDDKYKVIKLPDGINASAYHQLHLGKSKNGVYFALVGDQCQLQILFLNEFVGKMEWVSKHAINVQALIAHVSQHHDDQTNGAWILQKYNYDDPEDNKDAIVKNDMDWDSDDDNAVNIEDRDANCFYGYNHIFGFHPFREVIFLNLSCARVIAYHFDSSKVQDLGELCIRYPEDMINTAFVYTPCWLAGLSGKSKLETFV